MGEPKNYNDRTIIMSRCHSAWDRSGKLWSLLLGISLEDVIADADPDATRHKLNELHSHLDAAFQILAEMVALDPRGTAWLMEHVGETFQRHYESEEELTGKLLHARQRLIRERERNET